MRLHRFSSRAMGSALRLTVMGDSADDAARAWDAARDEMAAAETDLSRFLGHSALTRANRRAGSGEWFTPPPRLRRMLATANRATRVTNGRFDPRVLTILEAIGERSGIVLSDADAESAPPPEPAARWLERIGRELSRIATPIDSGGIGKGLGLRWAMAAALAANRPAGAHAGMLLDAGGDLLAVGNGPVEGAWSVGIEDPDSPDRLLAAVALRGGALATSSIGHRSWMHDGDRVHHLIDPRTGAPASTGLVAVTVALRDPAWAEVWTKALFLAGRGAIGEEARRRGMAVWWVEEDGSLHMTPAARSQTTWVHGEASAA
jgi:FAD:protein FMN transferase